MIKLHDKTTIPRKSCHDMIDSVGSPALTWNLRHVVIHEISWLITQIYHDRLFMIVYDDL